MSQLEDRGKSKDQDHPMTEDEEARQRRGSCHYVGRHWYLYKVPGTAPSVTAHSKVVKLSNKLVHLHRIPTPKRAASSRRSKRNPSSNTDPDHLLPAEGAPTPFLTPFLPPDQFLANVEPRSTHDGNAELGRCYSLSELLCEYDGVVFGSSDRIPARNGSVPCPLPGTFPSLSSDIGHRSRNRQWWDRHSGTYYYGKTPRRRDISSTSPNRSDQVDPPRSVGTTGFSVPSHASNRTRQTSDQGRELLPLPVYQLPSLHTSLPTRSRQPAVVDSGSGETQGPGGVSVTKDGATRFQHADDGNSTRTAFISSDAGLDINMTYGGPSDESYGPDRNSLESVHDYVLANEEDYLVGDAE